MGHKSKKHRKLKMTKQWIGILISMILGSELRALSAMDNDFAILIAKEIEKFTKELFASKDWTDIPDEFVNEVSTGSFRIYQSFVSRYMTQTLVDGFPKETPVSKPSGLILPN